MPSQELAPTSHAEVTEAVEVTPPSRPPPKKWKVSKGKRVTATSKWVARGVVAMKHPSSLGPKMHEYFEFLQRDVKAILGPRTSPQVLEADGSSVGLMCYANCHDLLGVLGTIKMMEALLAWKEKNAKLEGYLATLTVKAPKLENRAKDTEVIHKEAKGALSQEVASHEAITSSLNKIVDELSKVKNNLNVTLQGADAAMR